MVLPRAISNNIAPRPRIFFRPRPQAEDEKNPRSRGYIVGYSTRKYHIYNIYATLCRASCESYPALQKFSISKEISLIQL